MNAEPTLSSRVTNRPRSTIRNATIALIAAVPLVACSDDSAGSPAAVEATVATTAPAGTATPASLEPTPETVGVRRGTSSFAGAEDVPVRFIVTAGWETRDVFVSKS